MGRVRISTSKCSPLDLRPWSFAVFSKVRLRSKVKALRTAALAALVLARVFLTAITPARAQTRYASGQDVVPAFEGWERNPDGSFNMVFGYMNRNYEQQLDIPVGPDNMIEPGVVDQGQPTHFYVRRQQF